MFQYPLEQLKTYQCQLEESSTPASYEPYKGITYTLPTPITLNKVGDAADTYDVVSGVETRRTKKIILDKLPSGIGIITNETYPDAVGFQITKSLFGVEENYWYPSFSKTITNGLPAFDKDIMSGASLTQNEEGIGQSHYEFKFIISKSKLSSYDTDGVNKYLAKNPIIFVFNLGNKAPTIQHTLIPSTVETMQEPTFILPQPMRSVPNGICDRLYWDENKGYYCIEKRVGIEVFDGVNNFNLDIANGNVRNRFTLPLSNILFINNLVLYYYTNSNIFPQIVFQDEYNGKQGLALYNNGNEYFRYSSNITNAQFKQMLSDNPVNVYYALNKSEIIDLPHLNKKLTMPTQPDT